MLAKKGLNCDGYDNAGFDEDGNHRETGTKYDPEGYGRDGYNKDGWNRSGNHKATGTGYDHDGYDEQGYDRDGYDRQGLDVDGDPVPKKLEDYKSVGLAYIYLVLSNAAGQGFVSLSYAKARTALKAESADINNQFKSKYGFTDVSDAMELVDIRLRGSTVESTYTIAHVEPTRQNLIEVIANKLPADQRNDFLTRIKAYRQSTYLNQRKFMDAGDRNTKQNKLNALYSQLGITPNEKAGAKVISALIDDVSPINPGSRGGLYDIIHLVGDLSEIQGWADDVMACGLRPAMEETGSVPYPNYPNMTDEMDLFAYNMQKKSLHVAIRPKDKTMDNEIA